MEGHQWSQLTSPDGEAYFVNGSGKVLWENPEQIEEQRQAIAFVRCLRTSQDALVASLYAEIDELDAQYKKHENTLAAKERKIALLQRQTGQ